MVLIQYKLIQFFYQSYCFRRAIEKKAAYDNPPIADDQERRIDNAIEYNQSRGWSLQVSADKAGVTKSLLQWYYYHHKHIATLFSLAVQCSVYCSIVVPLVVAVARVFVLVIVIANSMEYYCYSIYCTHIK